MIRTAIKRHGGKSYLAKWIISHFPQRCLNPNAPAEDDPGWLHYVEPYFGGGSVLLANDPEGISEVVNDLDRRLTEFWSVMADEEFFALFLRFVQAVPFSEGSYEQALDVVQDDEDGLGKVPLENRAAAFFVVARQSRQGLGKDFATLSRNRTRRGMNEQAAAWLSAIEGLPEIHARLRRVVIFNKDALEVIRQQDGPRTLFYLDPPYLHETRTATDAYEHEMGVEDHERLLNLIGNIKGRFLLSGYYSPLYEMAANHYGWRFEAKQIDNKAGGGKTKRTMTEYLWRNFE